MSNIEDNKLVKEAMAEKMYNIQNDKGWEIYFRPLTDRSIEVISYYQGEPFVNPRKLGQSKGISETKSTENIEVMSVEDARECWNLWVKHDDYEVAEVEDYLVYTRTLHRNRTTTKKKTKSKSRNDRI